MNESTLTFIPLVPLWLLLLGVLPFLLMALVRRGRARLLLALVFAAVLSGPMGQEKTLSPLQDIVVVVSDESRSNSLPERALVRDTVLAGLRDQLSNMDDVDTVYLTTSDTTTQGSNLFTQMRSRLDSLPADRLSAIIAVTDGELTEIPDTLPAPLHILKTSADTVYDRRLRVEKAPSFALVNKPQTLTVHVEDSRYQNVLLTISTGGDVLGEYDIPTNQDVELTFHIKRAGASALELNVPVVEGELTDVNNRFVLLLTGVRETLNVLLVSGLPHNGTRVMRSLLKSDPAVHMVHFTILRTLSKLDPTPDNELSLIPFPVRELFEEKLPTFDLIIFDRYYQRGFISPTYFENINNYVQNGGAVLVLAGPDFAAPNGLSTTPLRDTLPISPTAVGDNTVYRPRLTEAGRRHPVTRLFADTADNWGRLGHIIPSTRLRGQTLIDGRQQPLLTLDRVGQGRIGVWMSDQMWFWSRGIDGGGPQVELLRRMSHWLMQEPELEEERLSARIIDGELVVEHSSLKGDSPVTANILKPRGNTVQLTLLPEADFKATMTADEDGLYTVRHEEQVAYAVRGSLRDLEWQTDSQPQALANLIAATKGSLYSAEDHGSPSLRRVSVGSRLSGSNWIGLPRLHKAEVTGLTTRPLLGPWLSLLLLAAALVAVWWYESRRG